MFSRVLRLAIAFLFLAGAVYAQTAAVAKQQAQSVVEITTRDQAGNPLGSGSGFIVRADGIVVTNHHVIDGAAGASVEVVNGDVYDQVVVLDFDKRRDLALLKIKALNLPVARLGDSETLDIGQHIVVIGNPEGLSRTVSDGIVSALRQGDGFRIVQTTAPISPGSSGGPVFNDGGEVVAIAFGAYEGQNLNLALPINYVKPMLLGIDKAPPVSLVRHNEGRLKSGAKPEKTEAAKELSAPPPASGPSEEMQKDGIGAFLDKRLDKWSLEDAKREMGPPLRHRFSYDSQNNPDGDIYGFDDPTRWARLIELNFELKTSRLSSVFIYPFSTMTWEDCKRFWGQNGERRKNKDGTKFFAYRDKRVAVILDKDDKVINFGLWREPLIR